MAFSNPSLNPQITSNDFLSNDKETETTQKLDYVRNMKFEALKGFHHSYDFDKEEEQINILAQNVMSAYSQVGNAQKAEMLYGQGIDMFMSNILHKPLSEVTENRDIYRNILFGGANVDNKTLIGAIWDAWKSEGNSRYISHLQNQFDDAEDDDEKRYLLKRIDEAELQQMKLGDYQNRGPILNNIVDSVPITRQGLRSLGVTLASMYAMSLIGALAGVEEFGTAVNFMAKASAYSDEMATVAGTSTGIGSLFAKGASKVASGLATTIGKTVATPKALGFTLGRMADAFVNVYQTERGSLSRELYNLKTEDGHPVDDETRKQYADWGALFITLEEYFTPSPFEGLTADSLDMSKLIGDTFKATVINYGKYKLATAGSESFEEFAQTVTGDVAKTLALNDTAKKWGEEHHIEWNAENIQNIFLDGLDSFKSTFFPMIASSFVGDVTKMSLGTIGSIAHGTNPFTAIKNNAERTMSEGVDKEYRSKIEKNLDKYQEKDINAVVADSGNINLKGVKLSKEEKANLKEQYKDSKMPTINVSFVKDSNGGMYEPVSEEDKKLAKYIIHVLDMDGIFVHVEDTATTFKEADFDSSVSNYGGTYDSANRTVTFEDVADLKSFSSDNSFKTTTNSDGTYTVYYRDENGKDVAVKAVIDPNLNANATASSTASSATSQTVQNQTQNTQTNNNSSKVSQDKWTVEHTASDGTTYETFNNNSIYENLKNAMPSANDDALRQYATYVTNLPENVQNSMIQKIRNSGNQFQQLFLSEKQFQEAFKNDADALENGKKGSAFTILKNAQIVLKDGKSKPTDVVHELHHVLMSMYPELAEREVDAIKKDLKSKKGALNFKRFYNSNKAILDSNGTTDKKLGAVHSFDDFMALLNSLSIEKLRAELKEDSKEAPIYDELLARMASAVMLNPDPASMNSLPANTKNAILQIVDKLKQIYKSLVGKEFAPANYEKAVMSAFNPERMNSGNGTSNNIRFSNELSEEFKMAEKEYLEVAKLSLMSAEGTDADIAKARTKLRKLLNLPAEGKVSVNQITLALAKYYQGIGKKYGIDFTNKEDPRVKQLFADILVEEIKLRQKYMPNKSAVGWYSKKIKEAHEYYSDMFPEIIKNPNTDGFIFDIILAVTSQGATIQNNANNVINAYQFYKKNGIIPTDIGQGIQANAIDNNIGKINAQILSGVPLEDVRIFFATKHSGAELKAMGFTSADIKMSGFYYGSEILGPKIGGAFLTNIRGNYDVPTLDKWMSRVIFPFIGKIDEGILNVKVALNENGEEDDDAQNATYEQFGNTDREFFMDVANIMKKRLGRYNDFKGITVADIQAVLWYNIKNIYNSIEPQANSSIGTDYATASLVAMAKYRADEQGITGNKAREEFINNEIQRITERTNSRRVSGDLSFGPERSVGAGETVQSDGLLGGQSGSISGISEEDRLATASESEGNADKRLDDANGSRQGDETVLSGGRRNLSSLPRVLSWWRSGNGAVYGVSVRDSSFVTNTKDYNITDEEGKKIGSVSHPYKVINFGDGSFAQVAVQREINVGQEMNDYIYRETDGKVDLPSNVSFYELSVNPKHGATTENASRVFLTAMNKAIEHLKEQGKGRNLTVDIPNLRSLTPTNNQPSDYRVYLASNGKAGFVLHGDEIKAVFADPSFRGASYMIMPMAISLGGRRLDCFDGDVGLQRVYTRFGFKPIARTEFSYEYMDPETKKDWKKHEKFLGTPDIYFMVLDGDILRNNQNFKYLNFLPEKEDIPLYTGADSYDDALKAEQEKAIENEKTLPKGIDIITTKEGYDGKKFATKEQLTDPSFVRFSNENEETTSDMFETEKVDENVDRSYKLSDISNPNNLINRNVYSIDDMTKEDVHALFEDNRPMADRLLYKFQRMSEAKIEFEDQKTMQMLASEDKKIVDRAMEAPNAEAFYKKLKELLRIDDRKEEARLEKYGYTAEGYGPDEKIRATRNENWARLYKKFYNYVHTASPASFIAMFQSRYLNKPTLASLLELRTIMGVQKLNSKVINGVKTTSAVAEKSEIFKALSRLNKDSSQYMVSSAVKKLNALMDKDSAGVMKEYARAVIRTNRISALNSGDASTFYSPYLSAWFALASGDLDSEFIIQIKSSDSLKKIKQREQENQRILQDIADDAHRIVADALVSAQEDINKQMREINKLNDKLFFEDVRKEMLQDRIKELRAEIRSFNPVETQLLNFIQAKEDELNDKTYSTKDILESDKNTYVRLANEVKIVKALWGKKEQEIRKKIKEDKKLQDWIFSQAVALSKKVDTRDRIIESLRQQVKDLKIDAKDTESIYKLIVKDLEREIRKDENFAYNLIAKLDKLNDLYEHLKIDSAEEKKALTSFYKERIARIEAEEALRNDMRTNQQTHDVYYTSPVLSYIYRFIHNKDKVFDSQTTEQYKIDAIHKGETTDEDFVDVDVYDYFDSKDYDGNELGYEVNRPDFHMRTAVYDPNHPRMDLSHMPQALERYLPKEMADDIKNGNLRFQYMTSADINKFHEALTLVKEVAKQSKEAKDADKFNRRRTEAQEIAKSLFEKFNISMLTEEEKKAIRAKMGKEDLESLFTAEEIARYKALGYDLREKVTDDKLEDYIRNSMRSIDTIIADEETGKIKAGADAVLASFLHAQRVFEKLDGGKNGALYNNIFCPVYEAYAKKQGEINRRRAEFTKVYQQILGTDENGVFKKSNIKNSIKALNEEVEVSTNDIGKSGKMKLNGWQRIGVYIYAQNIYGIIKLISSQGNNISLEDVARINPKLISKLVEEALATKLDKKNMLKHRIQKAVMEGILPQGTQLKLSYQKGQFNPLAHVSTDDLFDLYVKLQTGEIASESILPKTWQNLGDAMIDLVSDRRDELLRASYNEYNNLVIMQDRYFPLVPHDINLSKAYEQANQRRINTGITKMRSMVDNYKLDLNPLSAFYSGLEQQESIINLAPAINDAQWVMKKGQGGVYELIEQSKGKVWADYVQNWINDIAVGESEKQVPVEKLSMQIISNLAVAKIAGNLMTSIKQWVSLIPACTVGELNPIDVLKAMRAKKMMEYADVMKENAPTVYYSAYTQESEIVKRLDQTNRAGTATEAVNEAMMYLTEHIDALTKRAVWIAKFESEKNKGASNQDAMFRATQLVQTTQSTNDKASLAKIQKSNTPWIRAALAFTNDLFQTWNIMFGDIPTALKSKDPAERRRAILMSFGILLNCGVMAFLAGGFLRSDDDDDDDELWLEDYLHDFASEGASLVPFVGPYLQDAIEGFTTPYYRGFNEGVQLVNMVSNQFKYWSSDGEKGRNYGGGKIADKLFTTVMEGGVALAGGPATLGERALKVILPDGFTGGPTKDARSLFYLFGTGIGNAIYPDD